MFYIIHDIIEYLFFIILIISYWYWFIYPSILISFWNKVFTCTSPESPKDQVEEGQHMKLFLAPWIEQKTDVSQCFRWGTSPQKMSYIVLDSQGHRGDFWNQFEFAFAHLQTFTYWKLFSLNNYHMTKAAHVPVEIDSADFLIAHGASRFLKAEKIMELKRKGKTGPVLHIFILLNQGNDIIEVNLSSTKFPASFSCSCFPWCLPWSVRHAVRSAGSSPTVGPRSWGFGIYLTEALAKGCIFLWAPVPAMKLEDLVAQHGFKQDCFGWTIGKHIVKHSKLLIAPFDWETQLYLVGGRILMRLRKRIPLSLRLHHAKQRQGTYQNSEFQTLRTATVQHWFCSLLTLIWILQNLDISSLWIS